MSRSITIAFSCFRFPRFGITRNFSWPVEWRYICFFPTIKSKILFVFNAWMTMASESFENAKKQFGYENYMSSSIVLVNGARQLICGISKLRIRSWNFGFCQNKINACSNILSSPTTGKKKPFIC